MQRLLCGLFLLSLTACVHPQHQTPKPPEAEFTYQTEELPSARTERDTLEAYTGQSAAYSDKPLFQQTLESLADFERAQFQCHDLQMLQTQVLQVKENPAQVNEMWLLQACNTVHRYEVVFTRESATGYTTPRINYLPQ